MERTFLAQKVRRTTNVRALYRGVIEDLGAVLARSKDARSYTDPPREPKTAHSKPNSRAVRPAGRKARTTSEAERQSRRGQRGRKPRRTAAGAAACRPDWFESAPDFGKPRTTGKVRKQQSVRSLFAFLHGSLARGQNECGAGTNSS